MTCTTSRGAVTASTKLNILIILTCNEYRIVNWTAVIADGNNNNNNNSIVKRFVCGKYFQPHIFVPHSPSGKVQSEKKVIDECFP